MSSITVASSPNNKSVTSSSSPKSSTLPPSSNSVLARYSPVNSPPRRDENISSSATTPTPVANLKNIFYTSYVNLPASDPQLLVVSSSLPLSEHVETIAVTSTAPTLLSEVSSCGPSKTISCGQTSRPPLLGHTFVGSPTTLFHRSTPPIVGHETGSRVHVNRSAENCLEAPSSSSRLITSSQNAPTPPQHTGGYCPQVEAISPTGSPEPPVSEGEQVLMEVTGNNTAITDTSHNMDVCKNVQIQPSYQSEQISLVVAAPSSPSLPSVYTKSAKEDLLDKIRKVDREIVIAESQIAKLKKRYGEVEQNMVKLDSRKTTVSTDLTTTTFSQLNFHRVAQRIYAENRMKALASHNSLNSLKHFSNQSATDSDSSSTAANSSVASAVPSYGTKRQHLLCRGGNSSSQHGVMNSVSVNSLSSGEDLPMYNQPLDCDAYYQNRLRQSNFKKRLLDYFRKQREAKEARDVQATNTYIHLSLAWQAKLEKMERRQPNTGGVVGNTFASDLEQKRDLYERTFPELRKQREDRERDQRLGSRSSAAVSTFCSISGNLSVSSSSASITNSSASISSGSASSSHSGNIGGSTVSNNNSILSSNNVIRSEADMENVIERIQEQEMETKKMHALAVIPPMLLAPQVRRRKFTNNNGLLHTPMEHLNQSSKHYTTPNSIWSEAENEIFREKYALHPKNFGLIAQFLERRSVSDCVLHYYLSKKEENYKLLLRRSKVRGRGGRRAAAAAAAAAASSVSASLYGSADGSSGTNSGSLLNSGGVLTRRQRDLNSSGTTGDSKEHRVSSSYINSSNSGNLNNKSSICDSISSLDTEGSIVDHPKHSGTALLYENKSNSCEFDFEAGDKRRGSGGGNSDSASRSDKDGSTNDTSTSGVSGANVCSIPSCTGSSSTSTNNKKSKLRNLPKRLSTISKLQRDKIKTALGIASGTKKCCSLCFTRISQTIYDVIDGKSIDCLSSAIVTTSASSSTNISATNAELTRENDTEGSIKSEVGEDKSCVIKNETDSTEIVKIKREEEGSSIKVDEKIVDTVTDAASQLKGAESWTSTELKHLKLELSKYSDLFKSDSNNLPKNSVTSLITGINWNEVARNLSDLYVKEGSGAQNSREVKNEQVMKTEKSPWPPHEEWRLNSETGLSERIVMAGGPTKCGEECKEMFESNIDYFKSHLKEDVRRFGKSQQTSLNVCSSDLDLSTGDCKRVKLTYDSPLTEVKSSDSIKKEVQEKEEDDMKSSKCTIVSSASTKPFETNTATASIPPTRDVITVNDLMINVIERSMNGVGSHMKITPGTSLEPTVTSSTSNTSTNNGVTLPTSKQMLIGSHGGLSSVTCSTIAQTLVTPSTLSSVVSSQGHHINLLNPSILSAVSASDSLPAGPSLMLNVIPPTSSSVASSVLLTTKGNNRVESLYPRSVTPITVSSAAAASSPLISAAVVGRNTGGGISNIHELLEHSTDPNLVLLNRTKGDNNMLRAVNSRCVSHTSPTNVIKSHKPTGGLLDLRSFVPTPPHSLHNLSQSSMGVSPTTTPSLAIHRPQSAFVGAATNLSVSMCAPPSSSHQQYSNLVDLSSKRQTIRHAAIRQPQTNSFIKQPAVHSPFSRLNLPPSRPPATLNTQHAFHQRSTPLLPPTIGGSGLLNIGNSNRQQQQQTVLQSHQTGSINQVKCLSGVTSQSNNSVVGGSVASPSSPASSSISLFAQPPIAHADSNKVRTHPDVHSIKSAMIASASSNTSLASSVATNKVLSVSGSSPVIVSSVTALTAPQPTHIIASPHHTVRNRAALPIMPSLTATPYLPKDDMGPAHQYSRAGSMSNMVTPTLMTSAGGGLSSSQQFPAAGSMRSLTTGSTAATIDLIRSASGNNYSFPHRTSTLGRLAQQSGVAGQLPAHSTVGSVTPIHMGLTSSSLQNHHLINNAQQKQQQQPFSSSASSLFHTLNHHIAASASSGTGTSTTTSHRNLPPTSLVGSITKGTPLPFNAVVGTASSQQQQQQQHTDINGLLFGNAAVAAAAAAVGGGSQTGGLVNKGIGLVGGEGANLSTATAKKQATAAVLNQRFAAAAAAAAAQAQAAFGSGGSGIGGVPSSIGVITSNSPSLGGGSSVVRHHKFPSNANLSSLTGGSAAAVASRHQVLMNDFSMMARTPITSTALVQTQQPATPNYLSLASNNGKRLSVSGATAGNAAALRSTTSPSTEQHQQQQPFSLSLVDQHHRSDPKADVGAILFNNRQNSGVANNDSSRAGAASAAALATQRLLFQQNNSTSVANSVDLSKRFYQQSSNSLMSTPQQHSTPPSMKQHQQPSAVVVSLPCPTSNSANLAVLGGGGTISGGVGASTSSNAASNNLSTTQQQQQHRNSLLVLNYYTQQLQQQALLQQLSQQQQQASSSVAPQTAVINAMALTGSGSSSGVGAGHISNNNPKNITSELLSNLHNNITGTAPPSSSSAATAAAVSAALHDLKMWSASSAGSSTLGSNNPLSSLVDVAIQQPKLNTPSDGGLTPLNLGGGTTKVPSSGSSVNSIDSVLSKLVATSQGTGGGQFCRTSVAPSAATAKSAAAAALKRQQQDESISAARLIDSIIIDSIANGGTGGVGAAHQLLRNNAAQPQPISSQSSSLSIPPTGVSLSNHLSMSSAPTPMLSGGGAMRTSHPIFTSGVGGGTQNAANATIIPSTSNSLGCGVMPSWTSQVLLQAAAAHGNTASSPSAAALKSAANTLLLKRPLTDNTASSTASIVNGMAGTPAPLPTSNLLGSHYVKRGRFEDPAMSAANIPGTVGHAPSPSVVVRGGGGNIATRKQPHYEPLSDDE